MAYHKAPMNKAQRIYSVHNFHHLWALLTRPADPYDQATCLCPRYINQD